MKRRTAVALIAVAALAVACGGSGGSGGRSSGPTVLITVSAPLSAQPWIANQVVDGARLAADQANRRGGVLLDGRHEQVRLQVRDDADSPQTAAAIARDAVAAHAAALITDGVGAAAVAAAAGPAHLPVFVTFQGGDQIVDPRTRPEVFRIAPANHAMAVRLADYLAGRKPRVALLSDDSEFGTDGAVALRQAFRRDDIPVLSDTQVPAGAGDVSAQVLAGRSKGATLLVVWAEAPVVAAAIDAARSSGWSVPIWGGPTGEDPLIRQRLAAHPSWISGFGFVGTRITAEVGPAPYDAFRRAFEARFGVQKVGVSQDGRPVIAPPDWAMFSYDSLNLVLAALHTAGAPGAPLLHALDQTTITGANGDERGFGPGQREGVSPDDMYFARFTGFVFRPVTDDPLSTGLPAVNQLG